MYILFSKGKIEHVNIELSKEKIPATNEIKFLGMQIDRLMNFSNCIDAIKVKCNKRLNIIKILSHKSWNLSDKTLCNFYVCIFSE